MKNNSENPETFEVKFPEIAEEIDKMTVEDQDCREKADNNNPDSIQALIEVDQKNTARLKEIVKQIGWPTVSKVGKESSFNAWLLVQHADKDIEFQKYCLNLMKQESVGEVSLKNIAYLEDRIRVWSGQLQIYGTQFKQKEGKFVPDPMEDPENVDQRRAAMDLPTLAENTDEMYEKYGVEKPK
jgi:hypothetical protein